MLFGQGKLEKMTIRALLPGKPPVVSDKPGDTYVVQVNPTSYTRNHRLRYADRRVPGRAGQEAVYTSNEPTTLDFEFLFDATGVVPPPSELGDVPLVGAIASLLSQSEKYDVMQEIDKFTLAVSELDGDIHRPRKVRLIWGTLSFDCALVSLSYRFTLFKPDGSPLRAIANCSFRETVSPTEEELQANRRSPDLTHLRQVQEGDTLPLLAYRVYGNAALYLEVARVNRLVNFRRLRAGSQLRLPPVEKGARA
jgi:Contractile injection system tube protein